MPAQELARNLYQQAEAIGFKTAKGQALLAKSEAAANAA
jgi:hypothetical protein